MIGWDDAVTVDEHIAAMLAFMREEHEKVIAEVRGWAQTAEAHGFAAAASQHREHVARLEAMDKPWGITLSGPISSRELVMGDRVDDHSVGERWLIRSEADVDDELNLLEGLAMVAVTDEGLEALLEGGTGELAMKEALAAVYKITEGGNPFNDEVEVLAYERRKERAPHTYEAALYDIRYRVQEYD